MGWDCSLVGMTSFDLRCQEAGIGGAGCYLSLFLYFILQPPNLKFCLPAWVEHIDRHDSFYISCRIMSSIDYLLQPVTLRIYDALEMLQITSKNAYTSILYGNP